MLGKRGLGKRGQAGLALVGTVVTAASAVAQGAGPWMGPGMAPGGPGQGGVSYEMSITNGPGGGTVRVQGTGFNGGTMVRECMQPPGSPVQMCRMSINGQPGAVFPAPAPEPGMPGGGAGGGAGGPGPGWAPFVPRSPTLGVPGLGVPGLGAPGLGGYGLGYPGMAGLSGPQGFEVSGQGRWGPYAGSGTFSYVRPGW